jgi:hypothetical protein
VFEGLWGPGDEDQSGVLGLADEDTEMIDV